MKTQAALPSLFEAMKMVERLRLLSTSIHPQLHLIVSELESQLTYLYLESKIPK